MERIETTVLSNLIYHEKYCRKVLPFIKTEYFEQKSEKILFEIKEELGVMSREEKIVSLVFLFTALGWVFRKIIDDLPFLFLLEDAVISMMGGLSLFFLTSNQ